jgi:hypothetical protein
MGEIMPAVDPKVLKKLKIKDLLVPFAMARRLSSAQLSDLVARAMEDKRFDLSVSCDEFDDLLMDEAQAKTWAEELEESGTASHLFTVEAPTDDRKTFGGFTEEELSRMSPEQRLAVANKVEFERAR